MDQLIGALESQLGGDRLWLLWVFAVVLGTLVLASLTRRALARLLKSAGRTGNRWDDTLVAAATAPLKWFIWLAGLCWAANIAEARIEEASVLMYADTALRYAVLVLIAWFAVRLVSFGESNFLEPAEGEPADPTTVMAVGKLLRIAIVITAALVLMQSLGYSISGVLAFGGVGGIAVGFAAKDLLANFFGGLMVYMDRPFKVGDWVRSPDKNIEGTVEEIGLRLTRIRTFDKRPLYVPNQTFTQISVENPSRMLNRRIYETIGVRYADAGRVGQMVERVRAMLLEHPEIDTDQTLMVNVTEFASSSINFFIYTFTRTTDWARYHEIKQDVLLQTIDIIEQCGGECAFPTRTLHWGDAPAEAGERV